MRNKKHKITRSDRTVTFECVSCSHKTTMTDCFIQWEYHTSYGLLGLHKYYCQECSGLLVPIEDEATNVEWVSECLFNGNHDEVLRVFGSCTNAKYCLPIDRYWPECEHKLIDKNCLHFLMQKIEEVSNKIFE